MIGLALIALHRAGEVAADVFGEWFDYHAPMGFLRVSRFGSSLQPQDQKGVNQHAWNEDLHPRLH